MLNDYGVAAAGVVVADCSGTPMASVIARRGAVAALAAAVANAYGITLPDRPRHTGPGPLAFVGTGPGHYLTVGEIATLGQTIAPHAAVFDQTDGYALLRLHGPGLRATLAKGVGIDLHPDAFPVGAAASTAIGHIGANLWRLEDHADGSAVFEIAVFRSMAASFWHFLSLSAGEFGLKVEPA